MNRRRILFIVAHPPHRGALPRELLDALLVGAVFEQHISVLFTGDGVYQLLDGRAFGALPTYEISDVFADKATLRRLCLEDTKLAVSARSLTRAGIRKLLASQDVVISD
jgi:tRNA 2-thiouridine synthesizing protein C